MPKTIATTPSWYWPEGVPRVLGIPPYSLDELLVERWAHEEGDRPILVSGTTRMSPAELASEVRAASAEVARQVELGSAATLYAGPTVQGVVLVLGALASGRQVLLREAAAGEPERLGEPVAPAGLGEPGTVRARAANGAGAGPGSIREPAACLAGRFGLAWHSQRSLLASAVALQGFLGTGIRRGGTWLSTFSPCTWEGLSALGTALLGGNTLVLSSPGEASREALSAEKPTWLFGSFDDAVATWAGGAKRRRSEEPPVRAALLSVDGPFDPDQRRAVTSSLGTALTVFGTAETGPLLASHPSWYLDESIGIPLPNMHVVPAEPDTAEPITTLWELVDHAMVTAWSPSLMLGYEADGAALRSAGQHSTGGHSTGGHFTGRRFVTGVLAASDPNGMLYLLDDQA